MRISLMLIALLALASAAWAEFGFDEKYERDYNIFNPINAYDPKNPFNPINQYNPKNPLNPINEYNPSTPFQPLNSAPKSSR